MTDMFVLAVPKQDNFNPENWHNFLVELDNLLQTRSKSVQFVGGMSLLQNNPRMAWCISLHEIDIEPLRVHLASIQVKYNMVDQLFVMEDELHFLPKP